MFKINIEGTTNYAFQTTIAGVPVQTAPTINYDNIPESIAKELFWNGFKLKFQTVLRTMKPEQVKEMFASGKKVTWRECLSKSAAKEKLAVDAMTREELAKHIAELQKRLESADDDNSEEYTIET